MLLFFILILSSCTRQDTIGAGKNITESEYSEETGEMYNHLTTNNFIRDIVNHPAFKDFGNYILPRDDQYLRQLRRVENRVSSMNTAESGNLIVNLGQ